MKLHKILMCVKISPPGTLGGMGGMEGAGGMGGTNMLGMNPANMNQNPDQMMAMLNDPMVQQMLQQLSYTLVFCFPMLIY